MLRKIMNYMIGFIMFFLVCGIIVQHYISQPIEPKELICHKGRLLARVGDDGTVYTKVKEFTCDYQKGMLIIEEEK